MKASRVRRKLRRRFNLTKSVMPTAGVPLLLNKPHVDINVRAASRREAVASPLPRKNAKGERASASSREAPLRVVIAPSLLTWFEVLGYTVLLEPDIALGKYRIGRSSYKEVILHDRLDSALQKINPTKPPEAIAKAISQVTSTQSSDLLENNYRFHKLLSDGVEVEYLFNKEIVCDKVRLIDTSNLLNNDWLVIHPLTVVEGSHAHCPDVVVFVNGLPLAVIVLIDPSYEQATFKAGKERIQAYFQQIPKLFYYNTLLVITCQNQARVGTLTSDWQEFLPWRTIDGEDFPAKGASELEVLIQGIFDKRRFLEQVLHFIVFELNGTDISKKLLRQPFCTRPNSHQTFNK